MGLTMVLAPILGGVIAARLGWRAAFLVNLPICAALGTAAVLWVEIRHEPARRLDPAGILLFATLMFGLTWGLIRGQSEDGPPPRRWRASAWGPARWRASSSSSAGWRSRCSTSGCFGSRG